MVRRIFWASVFTSLALPLFAQINPQRSQAEHYIGVNITDFVLYNYNAQYMYKLNEQFAGVFYMAGGLKPGKDRTTSVQDIRFEVGPRWTLPDADGIFLQLSGLLVDSQFWYTKNEWGLVQGSDGLMYYEQIEVTERETYSQTGFSLMFGANYDIGSNAFVELSGSYGLRWSTLDEDNPNYHSFDGISYSGYDGPSIRAQIIFGIKF